MCRASKPSRWLRACSCFMVMLCFFVMEKAVSPLATVYHCSPAAACGVVAGVACVGVTAGTLVVVVITVGAGLLYTTLSSFAFSFEKIVLWFWLFCRFGSSGRLFFHGCFVGNIYARLFGRGFLCGCSYRLCLLRGGIRCILRCGVGNGNIVTAGSCRCLVHSRYCFLCCMDGGNVWLCGGIVL